jgi:hypothetical protein
MDMLLRCGRQEIDIEFWWRILLENARLQYKKKNM